MKSLVCICSTHPRAYFYWIAGSHWISPGFFSFSRLSASLESDRTVCTMSRNDRHRGDRDRPRREEQPRRTQAAPEPSRARQEPRAEPRRAAAVDMMEDEPQYVPMPRPQDARPTARSEPPAGYRVAAPQEPSMGMPEYEPQGQPQRGDYGITGPPGRQVYEREEYPTTQLVDPNPGSTNRYREFFLFWRRNQS